MRNGIVGWVAGCLLAGSGAAGADVLLTHARVYDGSGGAPFEASVRVTGSRIAAVGPDLRPQPGETVRDLHGLALAPGFIDMHSHHDRGLLEDRDAGSVVRQGVTLVLVGQDGESNYPLADWFRRVEASPPAVNVASMVGHATVRAQAMGKDLYRASTPAELATMKRVLARELAAGAFGLSTGLEYEAAHFSTTEEVVALARVAGERHGFYISHVRDEATRTYEAFDELMRIGREAHLPVEITHIKLGATSLWHQAATRFPHYLADAARDHVDLRVDVYPYTFWHSTIRVLVADRDFENPQKVAAALEENGGPAAIRISRYVPDASLAGHTLAEFAERWHVTPVEAYIRVVRATAAEVDGGPELEAVDVSSMSEDDVRWFVSQPWSMVCSDGELHGSHPRGAGTFPRVLGHYARDQHALPLELAVHKMTGLPARALGLSDRGAIAPGRVADLVVFDPATVVDRATIEQPEAPPAGIPAVMVGGEWVVDDGRVTGRHPGRVVRPPGH